MLLFPTKIKVVSGRKRSPLWSEHKKERVNKFIMASFIIKNKEDEPLPLTLSSNSNTQALFATFDRLTSPQMLIASELLSSRDSEN